MYLETLYLQNFRNLRKQQLEFKNGIIVFFGDNAQGKTNLLEAIYLLSTSKSFRTSSDHELISWGQEYAKVSGKADLLDLELTILPKAKKLLINKQEKRLTELIGTFLVVLFTPNEIDIVSGSPDKRRRFLDLLGISLSHEYLVNLAKFNKVLKARNQLLWQIKQGRPQDLEVWNEQLASLAVAIWIKRYSLIKLVNQQLETTAPRLLSGSLTLVYEPLLQLDKPKVMQEKFLKKLGQAESGDIARAKTSIGPQRDNFTAIFETEVDDKVISKDLEIYGSRGEQRAAVVALKLAEIEIILAERGSRPVLLLDEVLGELDLEHQRLLIGQIKSGQAFLTTTSLESLNKLPVGKLQKFEVKAGQVLTV